MRRTLWIAISGLGLVLGLGVLGGDGRKKSFGSPGDRYDRDCRLGAGGGVCGRCLGDRRGGKLRIRSA